MKPGIFLPKYKLNQKLNVYTGAPVNKGFYERNLQKAKTIYMNKCCKTPKKFFRRKEDRAFNQLINNYYYDYNKFQKKHKFIPQIQKPIKKQDNNINFNQYELKKKNLSVLFFTYDSRNNEEANFDITDKLINSMFTGKDDTLIKTTQIRNDYEMRLNENKKKEPKHNNFINDDEDKNINNKNKKKINFIEENPSGDQSSSIKNNDNLKRNKKLKKESEEDFNQIYMKGGDIILDDNYLEFSKNIYLDSELPLYKDIIDSNLRENYEPPTYKKPQGVIDEEEKEKKNSEDIQNLINSQKNQTLNKYGDGQLKRFKDMIISNKYPEFEQLTNPYYPTNYIPPPCFPKLPEDEEEKEDEDYGYNDFGFNEEDKKEIKEEDDENLILLSNQITNKDFPMFEHLIRNDFKGNYAPPLYKIPSHIQKSIQKENEQKEKEREEYNKNKVLNVETNINRDENNELKMIDNIIKDDKYPLFEQLINPYYSTKYGPPDIFPKPENLEEKNDEENYGYEDFEMGTDKQIEGNDDDDNLVLIKNDILNKEFPMFENLIRSDFKGIYAPPIYKIPNFMKEEKINYNKENKKHFEQMKGNYINYEENDKNQYPTVQQMVNSDFNRKEEEKKENDNKVEENYDDYENPDFE